MQNIYRILDVNFNRAREAVRVVEDYVRFVRIEPQLREQLKSIRHTLGELTQSSILKQQLIASRDVNTDMGSPGAKDEIKTKVKDISGIITANCKRMQEALRVLEEYTKTINQPMAQRISRLRFSTYEVENKISFWFGVKRRFMQSQLCGVLPGGLSIQRVVSLTKSAIKGGIDIIQLERDDVSDKEYLKRAILVRKLTNDAGILFIVNGRSDITRLAEADGVHLEEIGVLIASAREIIGGLKLIGVATHNMDEAIVAQRTGADYFSIEVTEPSLPLQYLSRIARQLTIPYIIEGISTVDDLVQLQKMHQRLFKYPLKVAVSVGVFSQPDVEAMIRRMKSRLRAGKH